MRLTRAKNFAKDYAKRHGLKKAKACPQLVSRLGKVLQVEVFYEDETHTSGIAVILYVPHIKEYAVNKIENGVTSERIVL
jgi:hypothetical protein